jgi:hypothetical protein
MSAASTAILSLLLLTAPPSPEDSWRTVELLRDGDFAVGLKVKRQATLADTEWLVIEFTNAGSRTLTVPSLFYLINGEQDDPRTGRHVSSGLLASSMEYEPYPKPTQRVPLGPVIVKAGKGTRFSGGASYVSAVQLGVPPRDGWRVRAAIELRLHLSDGRYVHTPSAGVPFEFDWLPPDAAGYKALGERLRTMLAAPERGELFRLQLVRMLEIPEVTREVSREELIRSLSRCSGMGVRVDAIASHLARRYPNDAKMLAYCRERLSAGEALAVFDVICAGFWEPSFTEPLVRLYEADPGRSGVLTILARHQAEWAEGIKASERLSAALLKGEPLLRKAIGEVAAAEFRAWSDAVDRLVLTGDRTAVEHLRPALDDRRKMFNDDTVTKLGNTPTRPRVCDHAAEAILILLDGNIDKAWQGAGKAGPLQANAAVEKARQDMKLQPSNAALLRVARAEESRYEEFWDRIIPDLKKQLATDAR